MLNFEHLDKFILASRTGEFDVPRIFPECTLPDAEFVPVNYVNTCKDPKNKVVHFFVDDYQFTRYWNKPSVYLDKLRSFKGVLSPDFSLYTDMPRALQIYNHYRKQWLGAYWQTNGIKVYPTVGWSDKDSFAWCFDGMPKKSIVAVSSVGTQFQPESRAKFLYGFDAMLERLNPSKVLFYGAVPAEIEDKIEIVKMKPYYVEVRERTDDGRTWRQ